MCLPILRVVLQFHVEEILKDIFFFILLEWLSLYHIKKL